MFAEPTFSIEVLGHGFALMIEEVWKGWITITHLHVMPLTPYKYQFHKSQKKEKKKRKNNERRKPK